MELQSAGLLLLLRNDKHSFARSLHYFANTIPLCLMSWNTWFLYLRYHI
jgi:hypothetical protein